MSTYDPNPQNIYVTRFEAAAARNTSVRQVDSWIASGDLVGCWIIATGSKPRKLYRLAAVLELQANGRRQGARERTSGEAQG